MDKFTEILKAAASITFSDNPAMRQSTFKYLIGLVMEAANETKSK